MRRFSIGLAAVAAAAFTAAGAAQAAIAVTGDDPDTGWAAIVDEGATVELDGTADGVTGWSWRGGTGSCTFGSPSAASTSFTCDDDGPRTITLTTAGGELTDHILVRNVAPTATLSAPSLVGVGYTTTAQIAIGDAGSNDTFACWIDWGDGTGSFEGTADGLVCRASHVYTLVGPHWAVARVRDDDGGLVRTNEILVTVKAPPTITATAPLSAREGDSFAVSATPDGATSVHWTATGGTGSCTFTAQDAASTSVRCDDDGLYAITATTTDVVGQTASASMPVQVGNVAPTLALSAQVSGATVTLSGTIADVGNDTVTCIVNWGDGSSSTVPASGRTCASTHTYTGSVSSRLLTVTASDDDGGTASASTAVSLALAQTANGLQQYALDRLRTLRVGDDLVAAMQDALQSSRWVDGNHLTARSCSKVFDDASYVARKLAGRSSAADIRNALVQSASMLARSAIAGAAGGNRFWLMAANVAASYGDSTASHGDAAGAIDAYGVACSGASSA